VQPQVPAKAFYLPFETGRRFCLYHEAVGPSACRGSVLYIHPFAEELNRSRRMAALQARAFAAGGWSVLQADLFGCGDSDGDFADADWARWTSDVAEASRWLQARSGTSPIFWGMRAGCLLASNAARALDAAPDFVFWQPVISGKQFLRQFLRIKFAAQLIAGDARERVRTDDLHAELRRGRSVEVAGYTVSGALAQGLDDALLDPPARPGKIAWLEVSDGEDPALTPAGRNWIERRRVDGTAIHSRCIRGPMFWQVQQYEESPALIAATLEAARAFAT